MSIKLNNSNVKNSETNFSDGCLSFDQLMAFSNKTLSSHQRKKVEKHLLGCRFCADAVEGMDSFSDRHKAASIINSINKDVQTRLSQRSPKKQNWKKYYAVAAILLITLISVFYIIQQQPVHQALFSEYFKAYPNTIPLTRGQQSVNILKQAMQQYELENYTSALNILNTIVSNDPENQIALFYAGICFLKLDESSNAITNFQKIVNTSDSEFRDQALWFLGLSYLKNKKLENAKQILNQIVKEGEKFSEQSKELLNKINSIQ